jgi:hypothetical protein
MESMEQTFFNRLWSRHEKTCMLSHAHMTCLGVSGSPSSCNLTVFVSSMKAGCICLILQGTFDGRVHGLRARPVSCNTVCSVGWTRTRGFIARFLKCYRTCTKKWTPPSFHAMQAKGGSRGELASPPIFVFLDTGWPEEAEVVETAIVSSPPRRQSIGPLPCHRSS